MRKLTFLFLLTVVFASCQKKTYPPLGFYQPERFESRKTLIDKENQGVIEQSETARTMEEPASLTASVKEEMGDLEAKPEAAAIPAEAVKAAPMPTKQVTKMSLKQRVVAKQMEKKIAKASASPEKLQQAKEQPNTLALLALIFGGLGLLLLLFSGGALALLLGIAGLVLGLITLGQVNKGQAPASSKTMALLGTIFGGVVALLGLIAIASNI
ncbi:hypothetical protein GCM10027275_27810 [Rhabdobacter roseus]|uniref:DUF4190 domain-containing protein n=1 Tax=Rhabdobacter roseus TaxID=1655419 RepID=A0A840TYL0_9BACT|nr:hypothetical protein [Rhabdobacter roseus]MBB5284729.1 hypothetical protein [Rhabdobacter roseus]